MTYRVIHSFIDTQDGNYQYTVGDVYPHDGYTPTAERISELASTNNAPHTQLIIHTTDTVSAENLKDEMPDRKSTRKRARK